MRTRLAIAAATVALAAACATGDDAPSSCAELTCADPVATCVEDGGRARCVCADGYNDVAGDGSTCTDIDECRAGQADCHVNALCTNTEGGYECACGDGFTGDGFACTDVDECAEELDGCSDRAVCENHPGGFSCACGDGFTGDGFTCDNIDECTSGVHECDANAQCIDDVGTYICTCLQGYTGDGFTCDDVDECATNTFTCPSVRSCANTQGSYACVCPEGYFDPTGDATTCMTRGVGRVVLIGHDYYASSSAIDVLVGNAVFSANTTGPVDILAYTEHTDNAASGEVSNVNAAINARAAELGRTFSLTTFDDHTQLGALLPGRHVLLVYEQELAGNTIMDAVGADWAQTLTDFVDAGGVVVVTDFSGGAWRVLDVAGLLDIDSSTLSFGGPELTVREPGDPIASGTPATYPATNGTALYATTDGFPIVVDENGAAVVISKVFMSSCVVVEDAEKAWPGTVWNQVGTTTGALTAMAAHDWDFGLRNPGWHYQTAVPVKSGERVSAWVRFEGATSGRAYLGFSAGADGGVSLVAAANTSELMLQTNDGWGYATEQANPFNYTAGTWYRLELDFGAATVNGRLYDSDGTTIIGVVTHTYAQPLDAGGVALRSFGNVDIDTVTVCP